MNTLLLYMVIYSKIFFRKRIQNNYENEHQKGGIQNL